MHNHPVVVISISICALGVLYSSRLLLLLLANVDPSIISTFVLTAVIVALISLFLCVFFFIDDIQDRTANQKFNDLVQPTHADAKDTVLTTRRVEVISAIVVTLTFVGLVVGIVFPESMIGPTLALAIILWPILYRIRKRVDVRD